MPRVIGIDIPGKKRLVISLSYIYGIGSHRSKEIIEKLGLNPDMRTDELTQEQVVQLNNLLTSQYTLEGELRRQIKSNIHRLISINCYRGNRHKHNLPTRGQRTKSNARTRKGNVRRTVAGKKKAPGPK